MWTDFQKHIQWLIAACSRNARRPTLFQRVGSKLQVIQKRWSKIQIREILWVRVCRQQLRLTLIERFDWSLMTWCCTWRFLSLLGLVANPFWSIESFKFHWNSTSIFWQVSYFQFSKQKSNQCKGWESSLNCKSSTCFQKSHKMHILH